MKSVQLPDMDQPASDATAHRLTYSDGSSAVTSMPNDLSDFLQNF